MPNVKQRTSRRKTSFCFLLTQCSVPAGESRASLSLTQPHLYLAVFEGPTSNSRFQGEERSQAMERAGKLVEKTQGAGSEGLPLQDANYGLESS